MDTQLPPLDSPVWRLNDSFASTSSFTLRDEVGWKALVNQAHRSEERADVLAAIVVLLALGLAVAFAALVALGVMHFSLRRRVRQLAKA